MAMSINRLSISTRGRVSHDPKFNRLIEAYLPLLHGRDDGGGISVQPHDAYKYEGDFFGLLHHHNIPQTYHWIILRYNGLDSPTQSPADLDHIEIPSTGFLDRVMQVYRNMRKKENKSV